MTADITIVGLGPGPADLRTVAVQRALEDARTVFIRNHDGADYSDLLQRENVIDLAAYRDPQADHGSRWRAAATAVVEAAADGPVVLAIPGHPRFGEMLTVETITAAEAAGRSADVLDGISMIDLLATALDIDPVRQRVQLVDGRDLVVATAESPFAGGLLHLTPSLPILFTHVYSPEILQGVSQQLARILPGDYPVSIISAAGMPAQKRWASTVADLVLETGGPLLALFIAPQGELEATRHPNTLQHIMARLRKPDGCPWDRKQTHESLAPTLVDEVYEVIDAINAGDDANIAEELGDLLMLITMQTQIAEERGAFVLEDVYDAISTKMVRRHPHVFGELTADDADDVVGLWHRIKAQERADQPAKPEKAPDGQPHSMPALDRAPRVLKKHPLQTPDSTPESRERALLEAVAAVVSAGDSPDDVLKTALFRHVQRAEAGA